MPKKRGRKPQVTYYPSKGGYFASLDGRRYRLATGDDDAPNGPVYLAALAEWSRILSGAVVEGAIGAQPLDTVSSAVQKWISHRGNDHPSVRKHRSLFRKIDETIGNVRVADLKMHHVSTWLDAHANYGSTARHVACNRFLTAINWYVEQGYAKANPLAGKRMPANCEKRSRGAEHALDSDLIAALMAAAPARFRDFLLALHHTGARPGEIAHAQPMHYDRADGGKIVFRGDATTGYKWKNSSKKKHGDRDRVIFLTPELRDIVERNIAEGHSWLFPSTKGVKINPTDGMKALRNQGDVKELLAERGVNPRHVIPYALRHSYATRALARGVSIRLLAYLMGTSVGMLEGVYGHLCRESQVMRRVFDEIGGGAKT